MEPTTMQTCPFCDDRLTDFQFYWDGRRICGRNALAEMGYIRSITYKYNARNRTGTTIPCRVMRFELKLGSLAGSLPEQMKEPA